MAKPLYSLVLHVGTTESRIPNTSQRLVIEQTLKAIAEKGKALLTAGATAVDVVENVVTQLEDDPSFNAGRGAILTEAGNHELEAVVVKGDSSQYGAVACTTTIKNPVKAARQLMETGRHPLLVGSAADKFAVASGLERVRNDYFTTRARKDNWMHSSTSNVQAGSDLETVGAVALDIHGCLAAAGSTGGVSGKMEGRIGDTAIVGAGVYADRNIAVVW